MDMVMEAKTTKSNRFKEGLSFLLYALEAFGVVGLELLIGNVIEPKLYGVEMNKFTAWQSILHWIITCTVWGIGAFLVMKDCKKSMGVDLFEDIKSKKFITKDIKVWQWICIAIGVVICLVSTWIDWNGSKVAAEFKSRGPLLFPFQYIYYLFEVSLVLLIIIFGQMAFEKWFNNSKIPFGGILVGVTWGLAHWVSKGSLGAGLYGAAGGFVFGAAYVLTNRNVKLSYLLLCIMFIL
ncbi:MAG: hypothetical protein J6O17_05820 [Eubacterium sp.]|nr:hypothetical protein [Eubacterium sp.]